MATSQNKAIKTPNGTHEASASGTEHVRSATAHLRQAARSAGEALQHANQAVSDSIREDFSKEIQPELGAAAEDARKASAAAAAATQAEWKALGRSADRLVRRSQGWVRERPMSAIGLAAAGGFVLAQLLRRR